jgi:hypothetical protein
MTTLRYQSEIIDFPLVLVDSNQHRIEFYRKRNDDETYTLVALSGHYCQFPTREKCQGPYYHSAQLLGITSAITAQLCDQGYQVRTDLAAIWPLVAQRISNEKQVVRNANMASYQFKEEDVYTDF